MNTDRNSNAPAITRGQRMIASKYIDACWQRLQDHYIRIYGNTPAATHESTASTTDRTTQRVLHTSRVEGQTNVEECKCSSQHEDTNGDCVDGQLTTFLETTRGGDERTQDAKRYRQK